MPPRRRSQDSLAAASMPHGAGVEASVGVSQQQVGLAAPVAAGGPPLAPPLEGQQTQTGPPDAIKAAAAAAEVERLRQEEAAVLAEAARIRARLNAAKVAPSSEPKRGKTHWDCLLEEMVWLAKEFAKERAWKVKTAKRCAAAAQKSERDLEARVLVRAREEEKALRKRAAWIAKEVAAFWSKAQRVVAFKVRSEVEAKKKEVMDKQLDFLLGQTQKYSTMLAERLKGEEAAKAAAALGAAGSLPLSAAPSLAAPSPSNGEGGEEVATLRPRRSHPAVSPAPLPSAAVSGTADAGDDSAEYRSGEDDDADNEATIEEEEALAAAEGRDIKHEEAAEVAGLDEEAELPLEELLARYGNYHLAAGAGADAGSGDEGEEDEPEGSDGGADLEATKLEAGEDEGTAALLEGDAPLAPAGEGEGTAALLEEPAAAAAAAGDPGAGPSSSAAAAVSEDGDEEEYRGDDDDADNEATIEEEEAMAAAEGRDIKHEEAAEVAGLDEEAELPLEELLARYGNYHLAAGASGGNEGEGSGDEEMPDAPQLKPPPVRVKKEEPAPLPTGAAASAGTKREEGEEEAEGEADIKGGDSNERMGNAIATMAGLQPLGTTLATADIQTKTPFLIKGVLREYQQIGLDWLVTLYHKRLNGILADEMGLGKTIQTIALLAHLACEKGDWGPHLVVVPTSVMLNWEMEFKKWCPAFKLLTYYGSVKERAAKRQGWSKPNAFHICITSYTLVLQDARMFKRKKWKYLILDEAHMIKNWKSQRWQTLLNFNSKRRLLITGTPLQNDLMELWSLMHFLMPQVFASHAQFKDWFSNPLTGMVEGSAEMNRAIVERLHAVLRPFLLRRLKKDVEKQLPQKHEHVVYCRLSKRQRQLYEEYMASGSTRATLSSGNFLGIMNCLMQLRKVCNHPDLFEGRPIVSAYDMQSLELRLPNRVPWLMERAGPFERVSLDRFLVQPPGMAAWEAQAVHQLALAAAAFAAPQTTPEEDVELLLGAAAGGGIPLAQALGRSPSQAALQAVVASVAALSMRRRRWRAERTAALGAVSCARSERGVAMGAELAALLAARVPARDAHLALLGDGGELRADWEVPAALRDLVKLPERRAAEADEMLRAFCCVIPKARAPPTRLWCSHPDTSLVNAAAARAQTLTQVYCQRGGLLHTARIRTQLFFPDRRLIQFDCGKLQELAVLLARLKAGGHKCLIFTQMSKMLDVLEVFLNLHAHTYVRLDGATKPEQRQILTQRFNSDPKIFCFILSTRSGGVGMNLIGADTVIFYDSDWNPAMDAQAQDRCHRIGQTREVHIYRLVSEHTIEENILKKSDQKRQLDFLAIQSGGFTTDILTSLDPQSLLGGLEGGGGGAMSAADIAAAMRAAEDEGDAAAAAAVEREAAAEMDEFVKEPGPGASEAGDGGDDTTTRDSGAGGAAVAGSAGASGAATSRERTSGGGPAPSGGGSGVAAGGEVDDEEMMRDVAAMAGSAGGAVSLAQLESALAPVERYAVRFIEVEAPQLDRDGLAAKMEAEYRVEEFDIERMEEAEEEREAEIDEDEEANVVVDWDEYNAVEAYRAQVEAAQRAEKEREAAEIEWLKNYYLELGLDAAAAQSAANGDPAAQALAIPLIAAREAAAAAAAAAATAAALAATPPAAWSGATRGGRGRGRGRGGRGSAAAAAAAAWDAGTDGDGPASKRQRLLPPRPFQQPWERLEDLLLCSAVCGHLEAGLPLGPAAFQAAADALAGGAAAAAPGEVEAAAARGQKRSAQACRQRYAALLAAAAATVGQPEGKENVAAAAAWLERQVLQHVAGAGGLKVAAIVHAVLERTAGPASCSTPQEAELARHLQRELAGWVTAAKTAGRGKAPQPPAAADDATLPLARQLLAAVQQQADAAAAAGVVARLPPVLEAARAGGSAAASQAVAAAFASAGGGSLPLPAQHEQQPWQPGEQAFLPLQPAPEAVPLEALAAFGLAPSLGGAQPPPLPLPGFPFT